MNSNNSPADYGKVFDHMLEGCQIISHDYKYVYVNDVVASQGRSSRDDLLGKTMMQCYPGIEKTPVFEHLRQCLESAKPQTFENEFKFPNGESGWFELRMEPLPEGVLILSIDITERKKLDKQRDELSELKNMFVRIAAHRLLTPLATMRWGLEDVITQKSQHPDHELRIVLDSVIQLINQLDDMITALHIAEDKVSFSRKEVEFASIWDPLRESLEKQAMEKQITVTITAEPLGMISCDEPKLRTMMAKLVDNAVRYTPPAGNISVKISRRGNVLHFEVGDNGIGIPDADKPHIGGSFYRASNAALADAKAAGVGLSITKHYAQLHGGDVQFTSREGVGSNFWFEILL